MNRKQATALVDEALEAYRALYRDNPQDYEEAARRQHEAAQPLAKAAEFLGAGDDDFLLKFQQANAEISRLEEMRNGGTEEEEPAGVDEEEPTGDEAADDETEEDYESARAYSFMAEPADSD